MDNWLHQIGELAGQAVPQYNIEMEVDNAGIVIRITD